MWQAKIRKLLATLEVPEASKLELGVKQPVESVLHSTPSEVFPAPALLVLELRGCDGLPGECRPWNNTPPPPSRGTLCPSVVMTVGQELGTQFKGKTSLPGEGVGSVAWVEPLHRIPHCGARGVA